MRTKSRKQLHWSNLKNDHRGRVKNTWSPRVYNNGNSYRDRRRRPIPRLTNNHNGYKDRNLLEASPSLLAMGAVMDHLWSGGSLSDVSRVYEKELSRSTRTRQPKQPNGHDTTQYARHRQSPMKKKQKEVVSSSQLGCGWATISCHQQRDTTADDESDWNGSLGLDTTRAVSKGSYGDGNETYYVQDKHGYYYFDDDEHNGNGGDDDDNDEEDGTCSEDMTLDTLDTYTTYTVDGELSIELLDFLAVALSDYERDGKFDNSDLALLHKIAARVASVEKNIQDLASEGGVMPPPLSLPSLYNKDDESVNTLAKILYSMTQRKSSQKFAISDTKENGKRALPKRDNGESKDQHSVSACSSSTDDSEDHDSNASSASLDAYSYLSPATKGLREALAAMNFISHDQIANFPMSFFSTTEPSISCGGKHRGETDEQSSPESWYPVSPSSPAWSALSSWTGSPPPSSKTTWSPPTQSWAAYSTLAPSSSKSPPPLLPTDSTTDDASCPVPTSSNESLVVASQSRSQMRRRLFERSKERQEAVLVASGDSGVEVQQLGMSQLRSEDEITSSAHKEDFLEVLEDTGFEVDQLDLTHLSSTTEDARSYEGQYDVLETQEDPEFEVPPLDMSNLIHMDDEMALEHQEGVLEALEDPGFEVQRLDMTRLEI
eukprot:CAMPEP_0178743202 /NCGR_PEP_ID=MMETSP0744-20121128/6078_1 /TAXON_ID=913974 /ORGANISM="Nitzschia punctata, Strain CCMP561" /LENGTH=659 /DNA_ID=CAMNT_0020396187 /DNA_START=99 /DNA_END=2078 /DNA_ORIENTATION=+